MGKDDGSVGYRRLVIIPVTVCGLLLYAVPSNVRTFYSALESFDLVSLVYVGLLLNVYLYVTRYGRLPTLFCKSNTKLERLLVQYVPSLKSRYMPLYWFPESRCQTILRNYTPCLASFQYRREVVKEPCGGQFYLDWLDNDNENERFPDAETRPTVLILPGITSTSKSFYIKSIAYRLSERGYRVAVMVYRGLEGMQLLTPRTYSGTCTQDLEISVEKIHQKVPKANLFAVGTSLGTLILGKYLKDKGKRSGIDGAMFFSCPFNAPVCAKEVETWTNRVLINTHVASERKRIYRRHSQVFDSIVDHDKIINATDMREFDQHFTAPVFGYQNAEEYYDDCVLDEDKLKAIKTPLLCVGSNDDPFSPEHGLPKEEVCNTDHVALIMTYGGGHVSHLQGFNPFKMTYFEQIMVEYLDAILNHGQDLLYV